MTTIAETFAKCRDDNRAALMPFITCGYPSMREFPSIMKCLSTSGADIIEVGFPHSDPLADGPVIQRASHLALERGFTVAKGFAAIASLRRSVSQSIVVMCYANIILRTEINSFINRCASNNVSGLIVPDMIPEESSELRIACRKHGIDFIPLVTLTSPPERALSIASDTSGFVYFVSVTGTTGARATMHSDLKQLVTNLRRHSKAPVAVGFGVSTPEMAGKIGAFSDGVIIGSAILQLIDSAGSKRNYSSVSKFLTEARMNLESQR